MLFHNIDIVSYRTSFFLLASLELYNEFHGGLSSILVSSDPVDNCLCNIFGLLRSISSKKSINIQ